MSCKVRYARNMDDQVTRADKVVRDLKRKILSGRLVAGERLPAERELAERELAERYKVSRITIRDAIARLAHLGFVQTLPQSGTFIADYRKDASMDLLVDIISSGDEVDTHLLIELMEIRRVYETYATGKAVIRMTDDDRRTLGGLIERLKQSRNDLEAMTDTDYAIHVFLIDLAGNSALRLFFNSFRPVYRLYLKTFYANPKNAKGIIPYYERLRQATELRDERIAALVMAELLDYAEQATVKLLKDIPKLRIGL